jgi:hypothetical protein
MADDPILSSYFWIKHAHSVKKWKLFKYNEVDQTPSLTRILYYSNVYNIHQSHFIYDVKVVWSEVDCNAEVVDYYTLLNLEVNMKKEHWKYLQLTRGGRENCYNTCIYNFALVIWIMQIWLHLGAQQVLLTRLAESEDTIFVIPRCDIKREEETTETAKLWRVIVSSISSPDRRVKGQTLSALLRDNLFLAYSAYARSSAYWAWTYSKWARPYSISL